MRCSGFRPGCSTGSAAPGTDRPRRRPAIAAGSSACGPPRGAAREARENPRWLDVDNVILCSGQESLRDLAEPLEAKGVTVHIVGGADKAAELDAKRAINKAARLAAVI